MKTRLSITNTQPAAPKKTGLFYDTRLLHHKSLNEKHVERPERIKATYGYLKRKGWGDACERIRAEPTDMTEEMLSLVHDKKYIKQVKKAQDWAADDTYLTEETYSCSALACAGLVQMCKKVCEGTLQNGFVIARPPGHHAEHDCAMGYCIFNTIAVAARVLQKEVGLKRILILDWDIHHGNGTQKEFYSDPHVLVLSIHRYDQGRFYPFLRQANYDFIGDQEAVGRNINIPWNRGGMTDADYLHAFHSIVMPVAAEFNPELILVSAGFDAALGDELGECLVSPACFAYMTHQLKSLANGKLVLNLEGGYHINAVVACVAECLKVLLGHPPPRLSNINKPSSDAVDLVRKVIQTISPYWSHLGCRYMDNYYRQVYLDGHIHSMREVLENHREYLLTVKYHLKRFKRKHLFEPTEDELEPTIYMSGNAQTHPGLLFCLLHDEPDLVLTSIHSDVNLLHTSSSFLADANESYIKDIAEHGHAIVDISIPRTESEADFVSPSLLSFFNTFIHESKAYKVFVIASGKIVPDFFNFIFNNSE